MDTNVIPSTSLKLIPYVFILAVIIWAIITIKIEYEKRKKGDRE